MDRSALFDTVLDPGERILWSGQPRRLIYLFAGFNFAILTVGLGYIFGKMHHLQTAPLPPVLELELVLVAFMLAAVGCKLGMRIFRAWNTSYAVTDRRLLWALGLSRSQVRTLFLADLESVKTEYRPKMGKVLYIHRRGGSKPFVWAVSDVEQVRQLIDAARTASTATAA